MFDPAALKALIKDAVREVMQEEGARPPAEFLSVADAARVAAVTPQTIRAWIMAGRLHRHHAGRELRVRRDELERTMSGSAGPPADEDMSPEQLADRDFRRRD